MQNSSQNDIKARLERNAYNVHNEAGSVLMNFLICCFTLLLICGTLFYFATKQIKMNEYAATLRKQITIAQDDIKKYERNIANAKQTMEQYTSQKYIDREARKLGLRPTVPSQTVGTWAYSKNSNSEGTGRITKILRRAGIRN